MAKRRNLKKEKAQRNAAYAKRFRKKPSRFQNQYKSHSGFKSNKDENNDQNNTDNENYSQS